MGLRLICPSKTVLDTKPDYQFHGKSSYLIAGGLGGLGRSAARWMASRGAKNLILLSRSGARSEANIMLVKDLKAMGVCVEALPCDVTDAESLRTALARCAKTMPPINGCMQACMHLSDAILENMTFEDWKLGIGPKVEGTWNLHRLLPCGMDFFICFSSVSGIIGSIGAANYCAGNTFMDAFVQHRIMLGEKATSLDLGWMESEGVVAENSFLLTNLAARGFLIPMSQTEFHAVLDYHCNPSLAIMTPSTGQIILGLQTPATMRAKDLPEPHWMQRSTFRHLQQIGLGAPSLCQAGKAVDYVARFRDAATLEDRTQIVIECLVRKLAKALSIPQEDLDTSRPLHTYGVDSLLAVELRNYLAKEMDADVTIFDIMGGASFQKVSATVAQKSQLVQLSQPPVEGKEKC